LYSRSIVSNLTIYQAGCPRHRSQRQRTLKDLGPRGLYTYLDMLLNEKPTETPRGQPPGIGDCSSIASAGWRVSLTRHQANPFGSITLYQGALVNRNPPSGYYGEMCYLFVAEEPAQFSAPEFNKLVWTLIIDERVPNTPLMVQETQLFVIYSTSPNGERWKKLSKSTRFTICIMNPWTRQEMH
jgi:hypothetical protein